MLDGRTVHVADVQADQTNSRWAARSQGEGVRAHFSVPFIRDGVAIGTINLRRTEVQLFTERQVALLETFADQAVIAIENTRLFEAEQARSRELQESLEYQNATSEVLNVISRSPSELQPVLDTIVATASRLCQADYAIICKLDEEKLSLVASYGAQPDFVEFLKTNPPALSPDTLNGRTVLERRTVYIEDTHTDPRYKWHEASELGNYRTTLGVPLLRKGEAMGVISLVHKSVKAFSAKQVELVTTFADQAVIAIENARLFEEVQARTRELTEALEYQTATADVLKAISRSTFDLQTVLDTLVKSAARLCNADAGILFRREGTTYKITASCGYSRQFQEYHEGHPITPGRGTVVGRTAVEGKTIHIPDVLADQEYTFLEAQRLGNYRALLGVPLLREGNPIGALALTRVEPRPFTDKQIELVTTFADQAVIAIENTRLLDELQSRTHELARSVEELRALGQVGQTVSSSLDLKVVLPRILEHACAMSETGGGAIYVFDKARGEFDLEAGHNMSEELIAAVREHPIRLGESVVGQCAERREAVQFEDLTKAPPHPLIDMHIKSGVRALLAVPLLHQDQVVGALVVRRRQPGAFPESNRHSDADLCQSVGDRRAQCPAVPRDRGEGPPARDCEPAQVAVRRQHEP